MTKSILRKNFSDRVLRDVGVSHDDLLIDSSGAIIYSKTESSVIYLSHDDGIPIEIIVTADIVVRDMLEGFDLVLDQHMVAGIGEDYVIGKKYLLPLYVLEVEQTVPVATGHRFHGPLKGQCEYAGAIFEQTDVKDFDIRPEYGAILSEKCFLFWPTILRSKLFELLHPLADFCVQNGAEYYVPNLSASNFRLNDVGEAVPYNAVRGLAVHAILNNEILYKERRRD